MPTLDDRPAVRPAHEALRLDRLTPHLDKKLPDPVRKRQLREELDDLRREREREDARNRAAVAEAEESKSANIRQRRLEGGSRFNLRYRDRLPDEALTPEGIKRALAEFVAFDGGPEPRTFAEATTS